MEQFEDKLIQLYNWLEGEIPDGPINDLIDLSEEMINLKFPRIHTKYMHTMPGIVCKIHWYGYCSEIEQIVSDLLITWEKWAGIEP